VLSIRLRRAGSKRDPHYRVVVTDRASGRDGRFVEILGHYHPRRQPAEVVLDLERTRSWLDRGAQMSDTVKGLYRRAQVAQGSAPAVEETPEVADEALAAAAEAEATEAGAAEADAD